MLHPFRELTEAWVHIEGIPPKWCAWKVFAQVAACFGILVDLDRNGIFKSFYETNRVEVICRDPRKIPFERLVEMKKEIIHLVFTVGGFEQIGEDSDGENVYPDKDNPEENGGEHGKEAERDDMGDDEENEAIDEIDRANFQIKGMETRSSSKSGQVFPVSATDFHPHILVDGIHELFIEEIRNTLPTEDMVDLEIDDVKDPERINIINDMVDEEKLKGIQFSNNNPEIVLPDNLDAEFGSVESDPRLLSAPWNTFMDLIHIEDKGLETPLGFRPHHEYAATHKQAMYEFNSEKISSATCKSTWVLEPF
ncbi:hypothetical protein D1007_50927 [Hordeum vulgare]|nr:hypothetical protein D1007_50927 [Hordeum vulgare]